MYINNDLGQIGYNVMGNYVNGALFRGRIFCRLHLNARLKFPAQCHMPKQTTCAVSDFRL